MVDTYDKSRGASARIKFDDEQFAALFNELQARGDKTKLMQLFGH
jgi:hypothetical protein